MTFRIERTALDDGKVFTISGDIAAGHEAALRTALDAAPGPEVVLDLAGLRVVDLDGVRLLGEYEARGAVLAHCPGYVRTWIDSERQEGGMSEVTAAVARENTVTSAAGLKVFYRSWRPVGASRALVVIIPGFKSHSGYYGWVAEELTAVGIGVYAIDLRGRGKSDGDRFYVGSFSDYLADVDRIVQVARSENPAAPLFLLGHSAGGVLACLYALDHQAHLAGLV
jgi:hypothetical protein